MERSAQTVRPVWGLQYMLSRLAEKYPDLIRRKDAHSFIVPKRCVSVREPYSEQRREAARERAKAGGYLPPIRDLDPKTE